MNQDNFTVLISIISLLVAALALYLNFKSHNVTRRSYLISREQRRNSNIYLDFVKATQLDDRYIVHLVVFNPSEMGLLLHSLAVFEEVENKSWIDKLFERQQWRRLDRAIWWPTANLDDVEIKYCEEEYKNMYVENFRDVYVSIPGNIPKSEHKFEIMTNLGGFVQSQRLSLSKRLFSHNFRQIWHEK